MPKLAERLLQTAVFLDRDGTIIVDRGYIGHPDQVTLLPSTAAGLRRLAMAGLPLVVITNQSGINRGYFSAETVAGIHRHIAALLGVHGVVISGWYACPHQPDECCACRKPAAGLILQASEDLGLAAARSFVIGDRESDLEAASAVGARGILISDSAPLSGIPRTLGGAPVVADMIEASEIIMKWLAERQASPA